ncbi:MAG: hypothetical protein JWM47_2453 [Acidimicrobiales bacterium]|nr:hypothetical protein [Acidimicrobiales bacterium]
MAFDDDPEDERPAPARPLPPEDRLWRHPSEIGATLRSSFGGPTADRHRDHTERRSPAAVALIGACFAGAAVAFGAMWLAGPTRVVHRPLPADTGPGLGTQVASFSDPGSTERLARQMAPSVATLRIQHDGVWTTGTALWVDEQGTLAAAMPVVMGATQLMVVGNDGTALRARLAGVDPATGIAALVVDHTAGTPVAIAEGGPRTGERAVVVGAQGADGGDHRGDATVAAVFVRAVGLRASIDDLLLHDAIQLDREIPGDAVGGALVDVDGAVRGMVLGNSAEHHLGTVVSSATLVDVTASLRDEGEVRRAWLGVQAVDLDPGQISTLRVAGGARLTEVVPGSPAAEAGLRVGDIVTAIAGHAIDDASDLVVSLWALVPGDRAPVKVRRGAEVLEMTATLGP